MADSSGPVAVEFRRELAEEDRWAPDDVLQWLLGSRALQVVTARALRRVRMTPESWLILETLERRSCIMSDLAEALAMQKGSLSRWIGRLEASGFVRCRLDPSDQRRKTAMLTKAGKLQLRSARSSLAEMLEAFDVRIGAAERGALAGLSRSWHAVLGAQADEGFE